MIDIALDKDFLKTLTILYVEDDEETCGQFSLYLSRRVGKLLTAHDGVDGLEEYRTHHPDMVITDIQMPRMDWLSMVQEIRKLDPRLPVIMTTAFEEAEYLSRAIDAGVDKYVTKPVDVDKLLTAMLQLARQLRAEQVMRRLHSFDAQSKRLEALGVVAVGMVHDFEIMTMSIERALADAEPESNLCKNLQLAYNSCKRAARLGRTLQGLAKDSCPHDSAGSLAPLIRESVGAELAGADIVLEYQLKDPLPTVAHNAAQMRTVFTQLVSNARKAMPSGGTLRISGEGCSVTEGSALPLPAGQYLHVCVGDSGVGIAPEDLASIFDPYWSSDPMGCRSGMGLGLTVCYSIIKKHHGLIAAESELGRGATIHIYLPAAE